MNGNRGVAFLHEILGDLPLVFTKTRGVEYQVILARNYAYISSCVTAMTIYRSNQGICLILFF